MNNRPTSSLAIQTKESTAAHLNELEAMLQDTIGLEKSAFRTKMPESMQAEQNDYLFRIYFLKTKIRDAISIVETALAVLEAKES